jgi:hypothetical protein
MIAAAMPLAADYPFMDILWSMIVFFGFAIWVCLVILMLTDVFRRHDIRGVAKVGWCLLLILFPLFGTLVYLIVNHKGMAEREGSRWAVRPGYDEGIRSVPDRSQQIYTAPPRPLG